MLLNIKKNLLTVQLISCIIINILKLRELHIKIMSSNLINKLLIIKDISSMTYDILTLNIISVLCNGIPLYLKLKNVSDKILKKIFRRS
jgi:hypothetical protein